MRKLLQDKLVNKYFLLFAANLLFFIVILSAVIYFFFVQRFLQNQFALASINTLSGVSRSVEYFVKKTDDIAKYYSLFDAEAISYSYRPLVQGSALYQFLMRVRNQRFIDDNIHSIYLYYRASNRVVDISQSEIFSLYPGDTSADRAAREGDFYDTGWLAAAEAGAFNREGFILLPVRPLYTIKDPKRPDVWERNLMNQHPNANVITLIRAFENRRDDPQAFVVANLNEQALSRFLANAREESPETSFILAGAGTVISHTDKSLLDRDLSREAWVRQVVARAAPEGFLTARIGGKKYAISYVKSSSLGWIYVSTVPYAYLTRDLRYLTRIILITVFLIALSALVSLYGLTRRVYSPIEAVFQKIRRMSQDDVPQGPRGDVGLLVSLLDDFKKNYDRLGKLVFGNYHLLKYNFLNRLITGESGPEEQAAGFEEYALHFTRRGFTVVTVVIDEYASVLESYSLQDLYIAKQTIIDIAERLLAERYGAAGTNVDQRHIAVIVNGAGSGETADLAERLGTMIATVKELLQLSVSVGIGGACDDLGELSASSAQSLRAVQNRVHKGKGTVTRYDEVNFASPARSYSLSRSEEQVVDSLRSGQRDKCLSALAALVQEIKAKSMERTQVESIFLELIALVHRQLANAEKSFDEICSNSFSEVLNAIATFETLDALHEVMQDVMGCICLYYAENRKSHTTEVVSRVMSYLQSHYDQLLSLDVLADQLKITPQYASRLIKDVTGVNFLDYLTRVRMKKAEELLVKTSLSVQEVAERVGYQTYRAFLVNFRAHTAMIPTQYRRMKNDIVSA